MSDTAAIYEAGLASCIRTIARAPREKRLAVFENMAAEAATFVLRGGITLQEVIDRLGGAAVAYELVAAHGDDVVQATLVAGIARALAEPTAMGREHDANAKFADASIATSERLVPIPWSKIHSLPRREPMIPGLLDKGAMSVFYGASGSGKTFFVMDLALRKALGWEWRGRKLVPGGVAYLAVEGGLGIADRLDAWRKHHKLDCVDDVPFFIVPEQLDLCHSDTDVRLLVAPVIDHDGNF